MSAEFTLFGITYTNNDQKMLVRAKKSEIHYDKFKGPAFRGDHMISQDKKVRENEVLICICCKTKKLVLILIINLEICL